jgi:hypothetical protein
MMMRKPLSVFILVLSVFFISLAYGQYFSGKFFRKSQKGISVQGTVAQNPQQGIIYAEVEAYPAGSTRIDFAVLKDSQGNTYQPLSLQKVSRAYITARAWPPASVRGVASGHFSAASAGAAGLSFVLFSQPDPCGTVALCSYGVPDGAGKPFYLVVGVTFGNFLPNAKSQVVIDTSTTFKNK